MTSIRNQSQALGIIFMLFASLFFSAADALGKFLTANYPIFQVLFLRSITGLLLILAFVIATHRTKQLKTRKPGWHLFRGIFHALLLFCLFYGLKHISLAEVTSIEFSTPFFIALLSPWYLNEKVTSHSWFIIIIGFIGVLFIVRPTPDHFHIAHIVMLGFAVSSAILILTARQLTSTESIVALNFYLLPVSTLITCYWAYSVWVMPSILDYFLFICLGFCSTAAIGCTIQAVSYAKPSFIAPMDYVRLIWVILLGYFIWGEIPDPVTWVGIGIIIVSGIYLVSHSKTVPEVGVVTPNEN